MKNNRVNRYKMAQKQDSVLIVIDVQDRLMPVIQGREAILENIIRLIKFSQILDMPIVMTEQEKLGPTLSEIATQTENIVPIVYIPIYSNTDSDFIRTAF